MNLINYSVKFSSYHSTIEVDVAVFDNKVLISVSDIGLGIAKKDLSKVFKKYYSGHVREKGMGLGLYLANEIIKKHKGTIGIKSKLGKGTTVTFTLPIYVQ